MRFFVQGFFVVALALVAWTALPQEARADKAPDCLESTERPMAPGFTQTWWDKRTPQQQKYMRELPCEERYIPMVCILLADPDLKQCTNLRVADFRASRACKGKGADFMSEEFAACREAFKKTFVPPFK